MWARAQLGPGRGEVEVANVRWRSGWFMKIEFIVDDPLNSARIVYDTLVIASAKTAFAPARRNPAP